MAQAQRLLEVLAQGFFGQVGHVMTTMQQNNDRLMTRLDNTEKRSDERWLALQNLLVEQQKLALATQVRTLAIEAGRKLLPLLPAAVSTVTGSDLIPQPAVEESVFDTIVENVAPEKIPEALNAIASAMGSGAADGGPLVGVLADQLVRAQRRKAARDAETKRLLDGGAPSMAAAEADAMGHAYRALQNHPSAPSPTTTSIVGAATNSHAMPPTSTGATAAVEGDAATANAAIVEGLLARSNPEQIRMLTPMLGAELVDQILARYTALSAEGKFQ
jgi:hypothetical protein